MGEPVASFAVGPHYVSLRKSAVRIHIVSILVANALLMAGCSSPPHELPDRGEAKSFTVLAPSDEISAPEEGGVAGNDDCWETVLPWPGE